MRAIEIGGSDGTARDMAESAFKRELLDVMGHWLSWLGSMSSTEELWLALPSWAQRAPVSLGSILQIMSYDRWWLRPGMVLDIEVRVKGLVSAKSDSEAIMDMAPELDGLLKSTNSLVSMIRGESDE